ncbi:MAG: GNAT family N-acetyltransferase [Alphaproteobacteria bacterium]|nr:GNAT family N-acetyltransferase [Alphaproteobacteria bacterium]
MALSIDFRVRKASPVDASAIARVYVSSWRSTYRGLLPDTILRAMSEVRETLFWWTALCSQRNQAVTLVVEDQDSQVIGFISAGPERAGGSPRRAEVYTLYLLDAFQRRGFGARLMSAAADRLQGLGFASLMVWVLAGNPARAFYERLGAQKVATRTIRMGGRAVQEIAFAWPDLAFARAAAARDSHQ